MRCPFAISVPPWLHLFLDARAAGFLDNSEDDELRGCCRVESDFDNELAEGPDFGRIQGLIDSHAERLVGGSAKQPALRPDSCQEVRDQALEGLPQRQVIGFEHRKPRTLLKRFLDETYQPSHV